MEQRKSYRNTLCQGMKNNYFFFRVDLRFFAEVLVAFLRLVDLDTTRRLLFLLEPPLLRGFLWSTSLPLPGFNFRFAEFRFARSFLSFVEE